MLKYKSRSRKTMERVSRTRIYKEINIFGLKVSRKRENEKINVIY